MSGWACGKAAAVAMALIVVAGTGVHAETLQVPRDLGALPRARFDWIPRPQDRSYDAREVAEATDFVVKRGDSLVPRTGQPWSWTPGAGAAVDAFHLHGDIVVVEVERHVDVERRLASLAKRATDAKSLCLSYDDGFEQCLDIRIPRRLDRSDYEAAVIMQLDRGAAIELPGLARLLVPAPPGGPAHAALVRALDAIDRSLTNADLSRRRRLVHAALSLLEALPGGLPERSTRHVGQQLAALLRTLWLDLPDGARSAFAQGRFWYKHDYARKAWGPPTTPWTSCLPTHNATSPCCGARHFST